MRALSKYFIPMSLDDGYGTFALSSPRAAMSPSPPPPVAAIPSPILSVLTAVSSFRSSSSDHHALEPPRWRQRVVQFDMSHNAIALAFFAFTASLKTASRIGIPAVVADVFFVISTFVLALCTLLTLLRIFVFPNSVARDFSNPRLINFFFLPAIIVPLALLTVPQTIRHYHVSLFLFYSSFLYQFALSLYTYGQWLYVSTPVTTIYPLLFMQTIAYFVLSIVASSLRLTDLALFLLVPGVLFWLVIFVTVFQHLTPALEKSGQSPNPIFCLFLAPPAQATIAILFLQAAKQADTLGSSSLFLELPSPLPWSTLSDIALYIDLFIYALLLRLFHTWLHQSFAIVWWAYVFPLSGAASAIILRYEAQQHVFWRILASSALAAAALALLVVTVLTLRAVRKGDLPKNESALDAYLQHLATSVPKAPCYGMSSSVSLSSTVTAEEDFV